MRMKLQAGLLPLNISAVLLILIVTLAPATPLRLALGLSFLLLFPGYVLMAALFPRQNQLDAVKRAVFSVAFSIVIVSLTGLALSYTPRGISLYSSLISVSAFIFAVSAFAWHRQRRLAPAERFRLSPSVSNVLGNEAGTDRRLSVLLGIAILATLSAFFFAAAFPKTGERFTEFYVLGPDGAAADYPRELEVGEEAGATIGIINREHERVSYRLTVTADGTEQREIGPVVLDHGAKWEDEVTFSFPRAGDNRKVAFLLYRDGETTPHLDSIHLRVNVREED